MLIYKYEYNRCNSIYISKTSRHLCNRVNEHKGISFRSGLQPTTPPFSELREHTHNNPNEHQNYSISDEEFKILDTASCELDLVIK